jgi:hypothetical protein
LEIVENPMTSSRNRLLRAWPLLVVFAAACGESTPTDPTIDGADPEFTVTPTQTVTAVPAPSVVTVGASSDASYRYTGSFAVTITNTSATAVTLKSITADLQQASAGVVITPIVGTDEAFRFNVQAPGSAVPVSGTLVIPFTFFYTLPNGGREALVSMSFNVATDAGATGAVSTTVTFQ